MTQRSAFDIMKGIALKLISKV